MFKKVLLAVVFSFLAFFQAGSVYAQENQVNLYFFWSKSCPHCAKESKFLDKISPKYPNLEIHSFEVGGSRQNSLLLQKDDGMI